MTNIPNAGEYNASWNNNGKKIAHDVVGPIAYPYAQSIYVTDVETGISTPLTGAEGGNDPAWSPDGKTIAFDNFYPIPGGLFTIPATGGARTLIRPNAYHATWSNKQDVVAFNDANTYSISEVYVTIYGDRP